MISEETKTIWRKTMINTKTLGLTMLAVLVSCADKPKAEPNDAASAAVLDSAAPPTESTAPAASASAAASVAPSAAVSAAPSSAASAKPAEQCGH